MFDIPDRISIIFDEDPDTIKLAKYKPIDNKQDNISEETSEEDNVSTDLWRVDIDNLV